MMGRTHALLGVATLWLLEPLPQVLAGGWVAPVAVAAAFGALLPDLDASESTVKYLRLGPFTPFAPLSALLHRSFGHRGLLHSLRGLFAFCLLASPLLLLEWRLWLGLCLGYASHLLGDASTRSGIPLLYPDPKRFHLLPRGLRLTTGSQEEEVAFIALAVLGQALLLRHLAVAP